MGLNAAGMNRFRNKVDETLAEMFPAEITFKGAPILGASSPGGRVTSEYMDGGESTNYRFPFRFPIASVTTQPVTGDSIDWIVDATTTLLLEVIECSRRPHESHYQMTCRKRRV